MKQKHKKTGFTLIELLVAVALMLILTVAVVTIFTQASTVFIVSEAQMNLFQNARIALDFMAKELASARNDDRDFKITNPSTSNLNDDPLVLLEFDTVTSWQQNDENSTSHEQELARVVYAVKKVGNTNRWNLTRQVFEIKNAGDKATLQTNLEIIAQFVRANTPTSLPNIRIDFIRFESDNWVKKDLDTITFTEDSDDTKMPHAVRITMELVPEKQKELVRTMSRIFWIAGASN